MISVVIPTFNEVKNGNFLKNILNELKDLKCIELIIVDSGSTDGTLELLKNFSVKLFNSKRVTRASRLNLGIDSASFDLILLHHPRNYLKKESLIYLDKIQDTIIWGGFSHKFDKDHWLLNFTSWYSNKIRSRRGILYLDHCIFFNRKKVKNKIQIPDVEIFEDTELSKILLGFAKPVILEQETITSAIRFVNNGIFKQALLNQYLKIAYYRKVSDKKMNKIYENKLNLNNRV
jgi:glycosyltransferase involved in cell wall biosynthesis